MLSPHSLYKEADMRFLLGVEDHQCSGAEIYTVPYWFSNIVNIQNDK